MRVCSSSEERGIVVKSEWIFWLKEINSKIWDLEADLRNGKEEQLGFEEIGKRAIKIRDWNNKRVALKNKIAKESGHGFIDRKINHLSE